jgi:hypothetical protein
MPLPAIAGAAAAVAARLAAKKAAQKVTTKVVKGKIVKGSDVAKAVKKVNAKTAKAEAKANARGLKAANKPTNKVGSKADKEIRSRTKSVVLSKEETATLNDYYYGLPNMTQVMSRRVPKNDARSVRKFTPTPKKKSAVQLRPKKK